jgi:hypothetical protein
MHTKCVGEEENKVSKMKISFSKTTEELLSGEKTQTRRIWTDTHAKKMQKCVGKIVKASKDRYGLNVLGYLKINAIYPQKLSEMTYSDVLAEGFKDFSPQDFINQFFEGDNSLEVWVVDFELLKDFKFLEEIKDAEKSKKSGVSAQTLSTTFKKKETINSYKPKQLTFF